MKKFQDMRPRVNEYQHRQLFALVILSSALILALIK